MDNLSENTTKTPSETSPSADLKFEEIVNIDDIQKVLVQKIEDESAEVEFKPEIKEVTPDAKKELLKTNNDDIDELAIRKEIDYNSKKFVIYIDSENVPYIEQLPANERREVINKILKDQNLISKKEKMQQEKLKFIKQVLVIVFTFLICFPIMFFCVNKSIEASMYNYQQAKSNFIKLYRNQGKIQQNEMQDNLSQ